MGNAENTAGLLEGGVLHIDRGESAGGVVELHQDVLESGAAADGVVGEIELLSRTALLQKSCRDVADDSVGAGHMGQDGGGATAKVDGEGTSRGRGRRALMSSWSVHSW